MTNLLDIYTFKDIDTDGSYYRVIRADVVLYKHTQTQINDVLSHFSTLIDKLAEERIFIKGNRLFWTYQNVKYWTTVSCWACEWDVFTDLMAQLGAIPGVKDVAYKPGELD